MVGVVVGWRGWGVCGGGGGAVGVVGVAVCVVGGFGLPGVAVGGRADWRGGHFFEGSGGAGCLEPGCACEACLLYFGGFGACCMRFTLRYDATEYIRR